MKFWRTSRWFLVSVLMVATIGCDRVTKHLAQTHLADTPTRSFLADTVRLEYVENRGAFLSLGASMDDRVRTIVLTFGVAILLGAVAFTALRGRWTGAPLVGAAILWAGGVSNLIDRITRGSVVDFLNIGVGSLRTGIFNVADVGILAGAVLIALTLKSSSSAP